MDAALDDWLDHLAYADFPQQLRRRGDPVAFDHPYASELKALLDPNGQIAAAAVFEIDGVPAVCLIEGDPRATSDETYRALQQRVWSQGLISVVLVLGEDAVRALPAVPGVATGELLFKQQAGAASLYSAHAVQSPEFLAAHEGWFASSRRVDHDLITNLKIAVERLAPDVGSVIDAQYLMAQVLFVSYLEHRGLIDTHYRAVHHVGALHSLVAQRHGAGLDSLFGRLKIDFNGDFLTPRSSDAWKKLSPDSFDTIFHFLERTDLASGQGSLWRYDFRFIPVELLSSVYESFIGTQAKDLGAFYTPRHLARLAVDEALDPLPDAPVVFDGACGSGILLTTAFRRLLGRAEQQAQRRLKLGERSALLKATIFGADVNESACRVTAFSLYLALLEDLVPTDIAEILQEQHDKLPHLAGENIFWDAHHGDVFHPEHPIVTGVMPRPNVFISNPPWKEPGGMDKPLYESHLASSAERAELRQIAVAFVQRITDLAAPGARMSLILPASIFLKPTYESFVARWFERVQVRRLFNLSDIRSLLFKAKHAAVVIRADVPATIGASNRSMPFEYLTPKADISLAYRRLIVHGSDRRWLSQRRVQHDPSILQPLYWGSEVELGVLVEMRELGTLQTQIDRNRFVSAKGFHMKDGSKQANIAPLKAIPFLDAKTYAWSGVALQDDELSRFSLKQTASIGAPLVYEGARVVYPDGLTPGRRIRAAFSDTSFSFNNSMACVRDLEDDEETMRFLAAYLCSDLAAYWALLTAPTAVLERTQIKKAEVDRLPFWLWKDAPDARQAKNIVSKVARWSKNAIYHPCTPRGALLPPEIETLIHDYFGLDGRLRRVVAEVAREVLPFVQPNTLASMPNVLQKAPSEEQLRGYAQTLVSELDRYRGLSGGEGQFSVDVRTWSAGEAGYGIVMARASSASSSLRPATHVVDASVDQIMTTLREHRLLETHSGGHGASADVFVRAGDTIVFAKPLVRRLWLTSAALDDAFRLLEYVQGTYGRAARG